MKNWIVIILLVYGSFILYIISNKWEKNIQDNWLLKNNTNLIEHYIYSEIDSLGKEGRQTLFKLADGSMFLLYIYIYILHPEKGIIIMIKLILAIH